MSVYLGSNFFGRLLRDRRVLGQIKNDSFVYVMKRNESNARMGVKLLE